MEERSSASEFREIIIAQEDCEKFSSTVSDGECMIKTSFGIFKVYGFVGTVSRWAYIVRKDELQSICL